MSNGKQDEPRPEPPNENVPPEYLAYAGWLLQNPKVLEVWGLVSDLPEIATPGTAVTLDAGARFRFNGKRPISIVRSAASVC